MLKIVCLINEKIRWEIYFRLIFLWQFLFVNDRISMGKNKEIHE